MSFPEYLFTSQQSADFEEQIKKLKAIIKEKENETDELKKTVTSKDLEINGIKETFSKEKEEMKKEVTAIKGG